MGGRATYMDLPMTQIKNSSAAVLHTLCPSSSSSTINFPVSINNNTSPLTVAQSSCETCCAHGKEEDKRASTVRFLYNDVFGSVPSQFEVETAVAALEKFVMKGFSSCGVLQVLDTYVRVEDAFRLLQTDPVIKKLVVSLSSDKAVWNAILNNQTLRQIRGSLLCLAENCRIQGSNQERDAVTCILDWILSITNSTFSELVLKFQSLMNEIFKSPEKKRTPAANRRKDVDDKIGSSLFLSVVILMIVVMARLLRI
ncbi:uncharacterized protein LOC126686662 [Mercurialis annua]|uniref:uncharacterized protein LOC126686662 n=1 Tax=Mercurialis annua TaxID=3986 RepID=UPI00215F9D7E|nr:uncharacterized protein LOC126686662 [Mercurialis annua]